MLKCLKMSIEHLFKFNNDINMKSEKIKTLINRKKHKFF